ncbi:hypothetical protein [Candidatus Liberibacter africanus]|uniref:hypothetical protein n=1 Tax=Liberibacter africanus TaxID=34020 RepID=UPI001FD4A3F2|nr:hypothetical protein [Candidatus Liberibacter africanus]
MKKNVFLKSRVRSIPLGVNNTDEKTVTILSSLARNNVGENVSEKNFSYRLRDILSFPVDAQESYDPSTFPVAAIEHDKNRLRRARLLGKFSPPSGSIFFSVHNYFLNKTRRLLYYYSVLSERNFFRYFVFLIVLLGVTIGLSYSLRKNKVNIVSSLSIKTLNKDNVDKGNTGLNIRHKITRRLLEDGSEVDMGPSAVSVSNSSNISNILFKNHTDMDKSVVHPLEKKNREKENSLIGESKVFINKGKGRSSIVSGKILWSLQQEKSQGLKGLVIKGDIPMIDNEFSASIILKCNADIALSVTHVMEIMFSFSPESKDAIIDLRQISMRKTENSPSIFMDYNIFMISKNSYLISLKDFEEDSFRNSKILEESRLIDIPITYRSGKKIILTIDKGKAGTEIFKSAIMQWENRSKQ